MTKDKIDNNVNSELYTESEFFDLSYEEHLIFFSDKKVTQADIDFLKLKKTTKITEKQRWNEEIFDWLVKCEVLFPYEIVEYLKKQGIQINELPWTPAHLRLKSHVYIENSIEKKIFKMYIGGNTAAPDWARYETKDYYAPDFDIYNDVTIKYFDGTHELWNYPQEQFPAVYACSIASQGDSNAIYIIGGLGDRNRQKINTTDIYELSLITKDIKHLKSHGVKPLYLHESNARFCKHNVIEMMHGNILSNGRAIRNLYIWHFDVST